MSSNYLNEIVHLEKEELEKIQKTVENDVESIKNKIFKNYEQIKPFLNDIQKLKKELKHNTEKLNIIKTFLLIEENSLSLSDSDFDDIKIKENIVTTVPETTSSTSTTLPFVKKFSSPLVQNWLKNKS